MDHGHVEPPRGPGVSALPPQQAGEPSPFLSRSLEVPENGGPAIVIKGKHPSEVFECIQIIQYLAAGPELCTCGYPDGIGRNTIALLLRPPPTHICAEVSCCQCISGYKHITLIELVWGAVPQFSTIQSHYHLVYLNTPLEI